MADLSRIVHGIEPNENWWIIGDPSVHIISIIDVAIAVSYLVSKGVLAETVDDKTFTLVSRISSQPSDAFSQF